MLNPTEDRVGYGQELLPPEGFHLVRAVATTYSLDFQTLIAALIPLGLGGEIDDKEMQNPIALLQAIRKVTDKLVVFCEAGQIKAPGTPSRLITLLDDIVVQVALSKQGKCYPSFHPKTWTIEYANYTGERRWRFIVLSRNLSKDHSWDVSVSLEGEKKTGSYGATKEVVAFLEFLRGRVYKGAGSERQKKVVEKTIASLSGVSFFCEDPFDGYDIFPMGVGGKNPDVFKQDELFDDRVVISPFLSTGLVRKLNGPAKEIGTKRRVLISRMEALAKLEPSAADRFEKYVLRQVSDDDGERHDLHAKVYLRRRGSQTELWLGSANATDSGMNRNVEMMVALYCANRYLNAEKLLADLCGGDPGGKASPLEEVAEVGNEQVEVSEVEKARQEAENKIKEFCRMKVAARATGESGRYRLSLEVPAVEALEGVFIWPINAPGNKLELREQACVFPQTIELADLSSLYVVAVPYLGGEIRRVVKLTTKGIPEERGTAVLNELVKDRPSLLRYLAMLLSPNPAMVLQQLDTVEKQLQTGVESQRAVSVPPGLYEEMLLAASEEPDRIREAGLVLSRLKGDDSLLVEYKNLYRRFAEALKLPLEVDRD